MRNWAMIMYAVALHLCWGVLLLASPAPQQVTAVHELARRLDRYPLGLLLIAIAVAALLGIASRSQSRAILLALPQQALLMASAAGAVSAMVSSQYADGVPRPWPFIVADQAPALLAAVLHTVAIIDPRLPAWSRRRLRDKQGRQ